MHSILAGSKYAVAEGGMHEAVLLVHYWEMLVNSQDGKLLYKLLKM